MFAYYLKLAVRSLRRNPALSLLMILSIAIGIGAAMTTLTVARVLSGDPLPGKSERIFYPQVDPMPSEQMRPNPPDMLDYTSAMDLWRAQRADRQTLVVNSEIKLQPEPGAPSMMLQMLSVHADFFPMFDVPFAYGGYWSAQEDEQRARVAVISSDLNQRLFGGGNSVGRTVRVRDSELRVVGVLAPWRPTPQYYTLAGGNYAQGDTASFYAEPQDVFVPFDTGLEVNDGHFAQFTCWGGLPETPGSLRNSTCIWLQLWVQLDTPAKVADYREFVRNYALQQQQQGRIRHAGNARLLGLMAWLDYNHVVPRDVRLQTWIALSFLLICLFNTVGLLLAKFLRRSGEIGVRRALGASRSDIFKQCLVEAGLVGLAGGILGWALTLLGLWAVRAQPVEYADLARLDLAMFAATFAMAVFASLLAGVFPASRASRIAPAMQLKTL